MVKIRVLHIFAPDYQRRFSGATLFWKGNVARWDNPEVTHLVLEHTSGQVVLASAAFAFEYPPRQQGTTRWERTTWVFSLLKNIQRLRGQYNLLHFHVLWWGGLAAAVYCRWKQIPTLYESVLLDSDTPGAIGRQAFGRLKLACLRQFKAILTLSNALSQDYLQAGFAPESVTTLLSCVDTALFHPVQSAEEKRQLRDACGLPLEATILVFVGSLIERKGVDILIRAFTAASALLPNLFLLLVGPKNQAENPSVDEGFIAGQLRRIEQGGLAQRVVFAGAVQDRERLAGMYRAADVFVFPSRREGLPNVLLEAMASGLPVVVSQLPELAGIVRHGKNGFFVPLDDPSALGAAILQIARDKPGSARIGEAARRYVETAHSQAAWQAQISAFYDGLLEAPPL